MDMVRAGAEILGLVLVPAGLLAVLRARVIRVRRMALLTLDRVQCRERKALAMAKLVLEIRVSAPEILVLVLLKVRQAVPGE